MLQRGALCTAAGAGLCTGYRCVCLCVGVGVYVQCSTLPDYRAGHSTGYRCVFVCGSGSVCAALCLFTRADPSAPATALCMCGGVGVYVQHFACLQSCPQHGPQLCVCVGEWECMCSTLPVYQSWPQHGPQLCVRVGEWECMCSALPVNQS